ncbi:E3 ubiquitin-protein ligase goliath-like isoform X2 [Macrosteles quadrilineatus]|uniref:E3 ubiquitin-protein ligase goliath-like isoform X2 n=1 Tax=Macrosteles quadrilineatus TaxID=74068 RepID=UPI0023E13D93|nr:E3 ubiquitin-protein ligase goliath-like isoform X2 [Macrosteles quadrilineatus]
MSVRVVLVFLCLSSATYSMSSGDWAPSAGVSSSFHHHDEGDAYYTTAYLNITFVDPVTGRTVREKTEIGKFGESYIGVSSGVLVHVRSGADNSGCTLPFRSTAGSGQLPKESWIALVKRGGCNFQVKVDNAYASNASGIIVYNDRDSSVLEKMKLTLRAKRRPLGAVFTYKWKGEQLAALADNGTRVLTEVTVAHHCSMRTSINRLVEMTSVLFVSISFVVLMLISLAWLVFYYVQRFRYIHAKDRLSGHLTSSPQDSPASNFSIIDFRVVNVSLLERRLCSAAKKALSKIPTKHIKLDDKGDGECCAICIEPYRTTEVVRILPCRHEFHRGCIDPWLVEHRTCPMCKMDILKHYGFVFTGSQESILHMDIEEVVSESESLHHLPVSSRSRSLSPSPRPISQFQIGIDFPSRADQLSRSSSPDELTPSLPHSGGTIVRPQTSIGCNELLAVPGSALRRSLSLDNCSQ